MYTSYWNLRESPFLNVDNEALLYPSPQLQEGVARLYYLIDQERTAGMVTGPYGDGKTYLLSCLVRRSKSLNLPLIRFDAIPDGSLPMARHILLIDEAQYLTEKDGLYLVHFLCNLTVESGKGHQKNLFTTILAGTPQLAESVRNYESLQRRIQLSWALTPLSEAQTIEYVQHHMRSAGGDTWSFTLDSLKAVHLYSGGVPRNINNLCDTALMLGFAGRVQAITPEIIHEAAIDTCLAPAPSAKTQNA